MCGKRPIFEIATASNSYARGWRIWRHFRDYFPLTVTRTAELDPDRSYILAVHPHGVLSFGAFCTFCTDAMDIGKVLPGIEVRLSTLPVQFHIPGSRYGSEYYTTILKVLRACSIRTVQSTFDNLLLKFSRKNCAAITFFTVPI